mmetsp:Transcript_22062/g.46174  ORF Transcript_22062/g.46174 Transcript_22062/m.46174 type:complete len:88 (+) Transcript_22062:593-856(+)
MVGKSHRLALVIFSTHHKAPLAISYQLKFFFAIAMFACSMWADWTHFLQSGFLDQFIKSSAKPLAAGFLVYNAIFSAPLVSDKLLLL